MPVWKIQPAKKKKKTPKGKKEEEVPEHEGWKDCLWVMKRSPRACDRLTGQS